VQGDVVFVRAQKGADLGAKALKVARNATQR